MQRSEVAPCESYSGWAWRQNTVDLPAPLLWDCRGVVGERSPLQRRKHCRLQPISPETVPLGPPDLRFSKRSYMSSFSNEFLHLNVASGNMCVCMFVPNSQFSQPYNDCLVKHTQGSSYLWNSSLLWMIPLPFVYIVPLFIKCRLHMAGSLTSAEKYEEGKRDFEWLSLIFHLIFFLCLYIISLVFCFKKLTVPSYFVNISNNLIVSLVISF